MTVSEAFLRSHGDDPENDALVTARRMPVQKPGRSVQTYGTPMELIRAVEARWGRLGFDLAASEENHKAPYWYAERHNSLAQDWSERAAFQRSRNELDLMWLNPPFANIAPWAEKCKLESQQGARIIFLVPASVGAEWFAAHVEGHARVVALRPRLTFEGCKDPYPKDCMLCLYGKVDAQTSFMPGFETWRWK